MSEHNTDIVDLLVGIKPTSALDALRARRPVTREQTQASWQALFEPVSDADISLSERFAVALFTALLHSDQTSAEFYAEKLGAQANGAALVASVRTVADGNIATGPYGDYPAGPLSVENQAGPSFQIVSTEANSIGDRLTRALEHTHYLVLHPRDAEAARLQKLLDAGWSANGIVTLSQLVSFLAFQLRVISGLKVLAEA